MDRTYHKNNLVLRGTDNSMGTFSSWISEWSSMGKVQGLGRAYHVVTSGRQRGERYSVEEDA